MRKVKSAHGFRRIQHDTLTLKACFITRLCMPTFTSTTTALCTLSGETSMLAMSIQLSSCTLSELKLQQHDFMARQTWFFEIQWGSPWFSSLAAPTKTKLNIPTPETHLPNPAKPGLSQFLGSSMLDHVGISMFFLRPGSPCLYG